MASYSYDDYDYGGGQKTVDSREGVLLTEFNSQKFLMVIRKSIIWIILIFGSCLSSVYAYLYYQIPIYRSQAVLKLEMRGGASLFGFGIFKDNNELNSYLATEIEIIRSHKVLTEDRKSGRFGGRILFHRPD